LATGAASPADRNLTLSTGAKRYALGVLVLVYTFNFIDRQILAILLPAIKAEFAIDDKVLGFLAGPAFAVLYATLGIPIAFLADRSNRRNLIALALAIWSGMTALSGVASNIFQLVIARIGVGIGEAGCSPPAHSMIADYYPPEKRSTAMGLYTLGISGGIMIAYLAGGWVAENIGWREAFFIVGIPGILLALIVRFTIQEPVRGTSENRSDSGDRPGILAVARYLLSRRSFLHMAAGAGLASFSGYAFLSFYPSFLIRSFSMSLSTVGLYLGLILGIEVVTLPTRSDERVTAWHFGPFRCLCWWHGCSHFRSFWRAADKCPWYFSSCRRFFRMFISRRPLHKHRALCLSVCVPSRRR
jgi:MFS family permease